MKTLAALLLLTSVAFAERPTPVIDGPTEVHAGALVTLDASGSSGAEAFGWLVDIGGVHVPDAPKPDVAEMVAKLQRLGFAVHEPATDAVPLFEVEDGGKRLRLSSYPGKYRVVLGVSNADGVEMLEWTVTVGGAPNPPDPPDPPSPIIEPELPAGKFGLAIKMWRSAQAVKSEDRSAEAKQLASALITSVTAADGQAMVDQFAATMKTQFSAAQKSAWEPWRQSYLAELTALQTASRLESKTDWVTAFTEMAVGLSAVEE